MDLMDERIYPLTFTPALRDYIWGGRRLETLYGRRLPPGIVAESWEISGHPNAPTSADAGYWKGQALPEILADLGSDLVGDRAELGAETRQVSTADQAARRQPGPVGPGAPG